MNNLVSRKNLKRNNFPFNKWIATKITCISLELKIFTFHHALGRIFNKITELYPAGNSAMFSTLFFTVHVSCKQINDSIILSFFLPLRCHNSPR